MYSIGIYFMCLPVLTEDKSPFTVWWSGVSGLIWDFKLSSAATAKIPLA